MRKLRLREIIHPVSGVSSFETQAYKIYKFSALCSVVILQIVLKNHQTKVRIEGSIIISISKILRREPYINQSVINQLLSMITI